MTKRKPSKTGISAALKIREEFPEPERCVKCRSTGPMEFHLVNDGHECEDRPAWICNVCGHAHLKEVPVLLTDVALKASTKGQPKKEEKLKVFVLTGDIMHAGRVRVTAVNLEEALQLAEEGDFSVVGEETRNLGFNFCGDEDGGVEEREE